MLSARCHVGHIISAVSFDPHAARQVRMRTPFWREQNQRPERDAHFRGRSRSPSASLTLCTALPRDSAWTHGSTESGWAEGWERRQRIPGEMARAREDGREEGDWNGWDDNGWETRGLDAPEKKKKNQTR